MTDLTLSVTPAAARAIAYAINDRADVIAESVAAVSGHPLMPKNTQWAMQRQALAAELRRVAIAFEQAAKEQSQ